MAKKLTLDYKEILIPAGEFYRGTTEEVSKKLLREYGAWALTLDEEPQRKIYLDSYYIDKYPVTNEQFELFELSTGFRTPSLDGDGNWTVGGWGHWKDYYEKDKESYPVICIPFDVMYRYAEWAGKRLPTEAEWEQASRGTDKRLWPWGDDFSPDKCNAKESKIGHLTPVDKFESYKSPYGCVDMVGNCWEMVSDYYKFNIDTKRNYYVISPSANPKGPERGSIGVMKGGSFLNCLADCRCSSRGREHSSAKPGFRCVRRVIR